MKTNELKQLEGTDRQVRFAEDVRKYVLFQLDHMEDQEQADKAKKVILRTKKAKAILDMFAQVFYDKQFIAAFTEMVNYYPKQVKNKKTLSQKYLMHLNNFEPQKKDLLKDFEYSDEESENNKIFNRDSRTVKSYLKYLKENICNGYFSDNNYNKLTNALANLNELASDDTELGKKAKDIVEKTQQELDQLKIYKPYLRAKQYIGYLQQDIKTSQKFSKNTLLEAEYNLSQATDYLNHPTTKEETKTKFQDLIKKLNSKLQTVLEEAKNIKEAKVKAKTNNRENTVKLVAVSYKYSFYDIGDLIYENGKVYKVTSICKDRVSSDDFEEMMSMGVLNSDGILIGGFLYPGSGTYYNNYGVDVSDTQEGQKFLKSEKAKEEKHNKVLAKYQRAVEKKHSTYDKFKALIDKLLENGKYVEDFSAYEDDYKNAEIIEDEKFAEIYSNYVKISSATHRIYHAEFNGLDGDDWGKNNFGSYVISFASIDDESISKLRELSCNIDKFDDEIKELNVEL